MKLMFPKNPFVRAFLFLFILSLAFTGSLSAQSRRSTSNKKAVAKKAQARVKDARKDPKKTAALKKAELERRRAALAEQRRREQAIREARARKLAFEHGLRSETVANISKDVTDGEDLAVRQAAVKALGGHAGSVVVMEAQTGKILTIVNQDWAIRSSIKPCSTIKLVTGVAGLNEDVINKENGAIRNTATRRDLDDAIAFSDNGYFQRVGANVGNAKMIDYAKRLGLGEPTGLNAPGESAGKLAIGNNNARIYSHGDDFEVTPLQLAVVVSEITNGGMRLIPRIPRNSIEKTDFQPFMRQELNMPSQNYRRMIPGMIGAAEYGTAHRGVDASLGIAGKTGSCISKGSWVGLFASVAPIEKPKYSVVVITRGQGERGKYAAAVAGQIYKALATQIVRTDRNLAQTEFKLRPKTVDARTAAKLADEADDDEATTGDNTGDDVATAKENMGRKVIVVPSAPKPVVAEKPAPKKLITRTVDSKPLFPPVVITYDRSGKDKKKGDPDNPE